MKALSLVREHLRPAPVTLTAVATECYLLHQALTRVHRDVLKAPNEVADQDFLQGLHAFLIGCKITISAVGESADELCQAMSMSSSPQTSEASASEGPRLQQLWKEERGVVPHRFIEDLLDAAEQAQTQRLDVDSTTIIGNTNHARLSFEPTPSSRNSSTQGSILDPPPLYTLSLHEVTKGYEYLGPVFPAPQGSDHRLGNIHLIAHDPEDERATSLLGAATRNLDLVDLSKATPEQIQQLQLQSTIIVSQETLRSTFARGRHKHSLEKEFAARPQERKFSKDFKVVIFGDGGVDKSVLAIRFIRSRFVDEYDPNVEDSYRKPITIDGIPAIVDVLDTSGQEHYSAMRGQYIRTGEGFMLVYSITSRRSFAEIMDLHEQTSQGRQTSTWPRVLVAKHCDRESDRQVSELEGRAMAERLERAFLEASSTTRVNVDKAFEALVREIRYHDAMGTIMPVKEAGHTGSAASNPPRSHRIIQDNTRDRIYGELDLYHQFLPEKAIPKRSNNCYRRRLE